MDYMPAFSWLLGGLVEAVASTKLTKTAQKEQK
jgi:hypothetical protein